MPRPRHHLRAALLCGLLHSGLTAAPDSAPSSEVLRETAQSLDWRPAVTAPDPALTPEAVVRAQLDALQHNDNPAPDAGIALAFTFASPGNQAQTGPVEKFIRLVRGPGYAPLLNFASVRFGPADVKDKTAAIAVIITPAGDNPDPIGYLFILSRQDSGPQTGCWMTDSVYPVPVGDIPKPE